MSNQSKDTKESGSEKIQEAMNLLVEASKDKKVELQDLVKGIYANVKTSQEKAVVKAKEVAANVDERVHNNPWPYIGGAALGGFIVGLLLRFRRKPGN